MWREKEIEKTLQINNRKDKELILNSKVGGSSVSFPPSHFFIRTRQDDVFDFINQDKWIDIKDVYDQFPDVNPQKLWEWIDIFTIKKLILYFKDSVRKYSEEEDEKIPKGIFYWKYKK